MMLITDSALSDQIKESWKITKTQDFEICGDYYYNQIDKGIFRNEVIEIKSEHLPNQLQEYIKKLDSKTIKKILLRVILEIFNEKNPGLSTLVVNQNRIKVKYE